MPSSHSPHDTTLAVNCGVGGREPNLQALLVQLQVLQAHHNYHPSGPPPPPLKRGELNFLIQPTPTPTLYRGRHGRGAWLGAFFLHVVSRVFAALYACGFNIFSYLRPVGKRRLRSSRPFFLSTRGLASGCVSLRGHLNLHGAFARICAARLSAITAVPLPHIAMCFWWNGLRRDHLRARASVELKRTPHNRTRPEANNKTQRTIVQ